MPNIARVLAQKLSSGQALLAFIVVVVLLALIQIAAEPNTGSAIWALVAILVVGEVAALVLNYFDSRARTKGLDKDDSLAIRALLEDLRKKVANDLHMNEDSCRANVFGRVTGAQRLQIVEQLMANMDEASEWGISVPIGRGAAGIAWNTGAPKIVRFPLEQEDEDLAPDEAARVDPRLKWIVSVPLRVDGKMKWIVNVDGEERKGEADLKGVVRTIQGMITSLAPFARKSVGRRGSAG